MVFFNMSKTILLLFILVDLVHFSIGHPSRELVQYFFSSEPENMMTYHDGEILLGHIPVSIIWYGQFNCAQKYVITNFLDSLTNVPPTQQSNPSVSQWFDTINQLYLSQTKKKVPTTHIHLDNQLSDDGCSLGKNLDLAQISELATRTGTKKGGIALVVTADDVLVQGFCSSRCGFHGSDSENNTAYIWVGNSAKQCPGECAWPFHQPAYGPNCTVLNPPNGDVGIDGIVMNLARLIADAITNPFGDGFYQGPSDFPLEAATACPGVYGKGAFPGFAGYVPADSSGVNYNANGANGKKYLLPALFHPSACTCTLWFD
ncbi:hypothetical protein LUZ60_001206 [Juncus effusus]|nr:hypothetical protein LUZ60_001206 [Juncus effusus]